MLEAGGYAEHPAQQPFPLAELRRRWLAHSERVTDTALNATTE